MAWSFDDRYLAYLASGSSKHPVELLKDAGVDMSSPAPVLAFTKWFGSMVDELDALSQYGEHVGLAFQIVDDILDVTQTSEQLGKTAGKDAAQHKITFPAVYGLDRSREMAEDERAASHAVLDRFGPRAQRLHEIADAFANADAEALAVREAHRPERSLSPKGHP